MLGKYFLVVQEVTASGQEIVPHIILCKSANCSVDMCLLYGVNNIVTLRQSQASCFQSLWTANLSLYIQCTDMMAMVSVFSPESLEEELKSVFPQSVALFLQREGDWIETEIQCQAAK